MRSAPASIRSAALLLTVAAAAVVTTPPTMAAAPSTVVLPAGSVNGLAAAIAQAGSGGTVLLKGGIHKEAGEVVVTTPVTITGEPGATLESATSPGFPNTYPITITAALHFKGAPGSTVRGIRFQPPGTTLGSCGVILEDSPGTQVLNNRMTQLQFGVVVQRGDNAVIRGNSISTPTNWDLDSSDPTSLSSAIGIAVLAGQGVRVIENQVANGLMGIFGSDGPGEIAGNTVAGNLFGIFFCHMPDTGFLFSGRKQGSKQSATGWSVHDNIAHNNLWGIIVADGAHDTTVVNNDASGNQVYDIELAGDTKRFAPLVDLAPTSHDNLVVAGSYGGLVVKDCGQNNRVQGTVKLVDHTADPCF
jgi:parallel beta-helix repeat protein